MNQAQQELFYDIYPVWEPLWWQNPWYVSALLLAGLTALFLIFFLYRTCAAKSLPKKLTLHEQFEELIKATHDDKHHYTILMQLIRCHLTLHYSLSESLTDKELIAQAQLHKWPQDIIEPLSHLIINAELAQFARKTLSPDTRTYDNLLAQKIITYQPHAPVNSPQ